MRVPCLAAAIAALATCGQLQPIPPSPGNLLIATESNRDAGFAETVIIVLHHDPSRSLGLVINRRLGEPIATLFPDLKTGSARMEPLWAGGPVALGVNALVRSDQPPALIRGVHLLTDRRAIREALAHSPPAGSVRVFVGLCSWGAGQMDDEIARGLWRTMAADTAVVFDSHPETLWRRLAKKRRSPPE